MAQRLDAEQTGGMSLSSEVQKNAHQYQFDKLTEWLEKAVGGGETAVGRLDSPKQEPVRFRATPSLGFAKADIDSLHKVGGQYELQVNFMGLYGPASPLPTYMTEAVIAEQNTVEHEDLKVYFLTTHADVRAFQSQRIDVSSYLLLANAIRPKIRAGALESLRLTDEQMNALKQGDRLSQVIGTESADKFHDQRLVLEVAEKAAGQLRDFFDIFNHRLISLYYRATKKYQPYRDYQRGGVDAFSEQVYALMGAPGAEQRAKSALQWPRLLHYIGLLGIKLATKERLIKVVTGYFNLPGVEVKEGVLRYADIAPEQQCRLGVQNMALGERFMLGEQVPDRNGKFTLVLRHLDFDTFNHFLPPSNDPQDTSTGKYYSALHELIAFIAPPHLLYDIELELVEPPAFILGENAKCRLGWSTWAGECERSSCRVIVT